MAWLDVVRRMRTLRLSSGVEVPVLGQGTWEMGVRRSSRAQEVEALRAGLDAGLRLIDTAEMYADGGAEEVVGEAIQGRRAEVFLVSKVLPEHATRQGMVEACRRSLARLKTDHLDLYLLHWRGEVPVGETLEGFQELVREGAIRSYGVSNFDLGELEEALAAPWGGGIAANQVLYNLSHRGIEWDLLPACRSRGLPIMAYSPFHQGPLLRQARLKALAARHGATAAQVALAWVLRQDGIITIPKAGRLDHVRQNRAALELRLSVQDLAELDAAFPPPGQKITLETT